MTTKKIVGVKVTGELKQWRRKSVSELIVVGIIDGGYSKLNLAYPLVHFPQGRDTPEHYLARTTDGSYYYLALEEERHED